MCRTTYQTRRPLAIARCPPADPTGRFARFLSGPLAFCTIQPVASARRATVQIFIPFFIRPLPITAPGWHAAR